MLKFLKLAFFSFFFLNIILLTGFFYLKTKKEKEEFKNSFDQKKIINQTSKTKTNKTSNEEIDKNRIRDFVYVFKKKGNIREINYGNRTAYRLDGWIDSFNTKTGEVTISKDYINLMPDYRFKISSYTKLHMVLGIDVNNQFVTKEISLNELKRGSNVSLICDDKECKNILLISVFKEIILK